MTNSNDSIVATGPRSGFRLSRLEVFNWGTFDRDVWAFEPGGNNTLLTGDIGSGKSTLVDAITTLLVPPQKLAYNKAAGADARERSLRSYVLGHYKSERGESGNAARSVPLRNHNSYSVILARFVNDGFAETVTLAAVFWIKDTEGQPGRMLIVADEPLSVAEHFGNFGSEIGDLRKRLRRQGHEIHDSFPAYGTAFRRRFGIDNEQALELFHQTVSMKSVGNLTDFVRQHMLQPFAIEERTDALIRHFEDLSRAHEAVVKARAQIELLVPLTSDCERHAEVVAQVESLRASRDALRPWFAREKGVLLERRIENLTADLVRLGDRIGTLRELRAGQHAERDEIKQAIAANGGDRIERIKAEVLRFQADLSARRNRSDRYNEIAARLGLPKANDADVFGANRTSIVASREAAESENARLQNALVDVTGEFQRLRSEHGAVDDEIASLRKRRSNIPARMLKLRDGMCDALDLDEDALPFAGELLQVQPTDRDWEGAVERLVHSFGLSLLVPDGQYAAVAQWVERTHLAERLVYYRVRAVRAVGHESLHADSLVHKLAVKPDSQFYNWLDSELAHRFDYACCDTLDQFRREPQAITRAGQIKGKGERHEKDDRHRLDDRSRYVLGWSNEEKIAVLEKEARGLETRMQSLGDKIAALTAERSALSDRITSLSQLAIFDAFREIDWKPLATQIHALEEERRRLESESDVLRLLEGRLAEVEKALAGSEKTLEETNRLQQSASDKLDTARKQMGDCVALLAATSETVKTTFAVVDVIVDQAIGTQVRTVESCDHREKEVRDWLQIKIDNESKTLSRLAEKIVGSMQVYRQAYPQDSRDADASVAAASEYTAMLARLRADDLPRFEVRFKELLNENTIREVANFQSQLGRERQNIRERIETINKSLHEIDYNPNRYIVLEDDPSTDAEIRDFQQDLRACTEGTLTGSDDEAYSEAKFVQVKRIIERFRGREGSTDLDAKWARKVTDVRNWFAFSASERWREDDREHEHYTDSGGKSGGQKEKLAYTVLAASLAYQFGLEWGAARSRSFRFVVIDEAFGRGSDESTRYGLELFDRLHLQLLIVTPLQKIHVIEPHVAGVGFVSNEDGRCSKLRNLTIEEYRAEHAARTG